MQITCTNVKKNSYVCKLLSPCHGPKKTCGVGGHPTRSGVNIPSKMPDRLPDERMLERMRDRMSEYMSDRMPHTYNQYMIPCLFAIDQILIAGGC